ncbi:tRNA a64-2'-o-ribosylphosphate transferase [Acrodontium crateriforme]|uniref:tRNA a64-2'-o-ribosylphosphate transferase n=1 Tax=Acrodontium crateriforme TaxID=150365 RepID=A0AAQ3R7M8_9PEZI|nr:tRNA a64-2'-o-ribosylphosphate transferase [Acrodontium crateriforme]
MQSNPHPSPLRESDLIFPSAATSIGSTLTALKRSNLKISNRLQSIAQDALFVQDIAALYQLPLVANERCGSWYIRPDVKIGSAYFKSTDGHFGQWGVSLRRLNLGVLEIAGQNGGYVYSIFSLCIIVDSTRRGKSMPDALSKTIPIWIVVMNRLLFPEKTQPHLLHTPPDVVSRSEYAQIEDRLSIALEGIKSLSLDISGLRAKLKDKPMFPVWVTPGTRDLESCAPDDYNLIVMCTASGSMSEPGHNINGYVQGAADDHESWAQGLDAITFWQHKNELLSASEDELPALIAHLLAAQPININSRRPRQILPTTWLWISDMNSAEQDGTQFDLTISCCTESNAILSKQLGSRYLNLTCSSGKIGSRQLRTELPKLHSLATMMSAESRILISCPDGKDLSVGAALAMICLFCDDKGSTSDTTSKRDTPTKDLIKQRLSWIMVSIPDAKPSRATLQSVNAFLMG